MRQHLTVSSVENYNNKEQIFNLQNTILKTFVVIIAVWIQIRSNLGYYDK